MKIGICQTKIIFENKRENIEKAKDFIHKAAEKGADMVLFPEMSFTGFSMNTALTGEKDNNTVNSMRRQAKENGIAIGFGRTALTDSKAENRYTVLNKNGDIISEYSKIHPFSYSNEDKYFQGGNNITLFEYGGFKISPFICYDLRFPEIFQSASKEAELIIVPANWPAIRSEHWKALLKARAIENICYVIGINCTGTSGGIEYIGESCAYSPDGKLLYNMGNDEGIGIIDIENNVAAFRKAFPTKKDRRTELYKKLI